ncbi:MAG: chromate resistance protein ChrB domain-containing protein [Rhizobiaceae bacterium]
MPSPTQISVLHLLRLIGTQKCPVLIDVCIDEDFADDPRLVPTAFRYPFPRINELVPRLGNKKAVVICQKGLKLSEGAAALLRAEGIDAEHLEGGNFAWRDANAPLVPAKIIPKRNLKGHTQWVTGHGPGIVRIACTWLIRRFVDPDARFLFVSPSEVLNIAEKFDAVPFDVESVFWSHRNEKNTFDTMLEEFQLGSKQLTRMADIIRGCEINHREAAPESAGLFAVFSGFSRLHEGDLGRLEVGMLFYDGLYRWACDAADEVHNWYPPTKALNPHE